MYRRNRGRVTKRYVSRAISRRIETKVTTGAFPYTNLDSIGSRTCMNAITQGSGAFNRVGDEIDAKFFKMRFFFDGNPSLTTDNTNKCRIVIIRCRDLIDPSTAATWPAWNDVFPNFSTTPVGELFNLFVNAHHPHFKIVKDRTFLVTQSFPRQHQVTMKMNRKVRGKMKWQDDGDLYNALIAYVYTDSSVAPHPGVAFDNRLGWKDA